ncbi:MAG: glycerate kinase [Clostridia bacterium]|jgi:glycerate kinase|uniref:glycerate kinase n=1 Tax=Petroclostridium xylanilyticum TaxID=1792311 RepID=UPI000B993C07|nr:glycerate kinase [Petroclostridium xylanilyticum]MBZ4645925.1 glycerate kinase [Clostridia bacterium]
MKIIIAPDSFKGSNTTIAVANTIEKGIRKVFPDAEIVKIPIADGGEGTVDALVLGAGGKFKEITVTGPLGEKVQAKYGILDNGAAVIEMAAASGLPLVPENKKNPMVTTTYGTGELIKAALDDGCRKIVIGIGGSATNDGGLGMAQALGVSFKDKDGKELGYGGGELEKLAVIDVSNIDPRIKDTEIIIACDVSNPLCGEKGASAVYGPQKGATPEMVKQLDANLRHFARIIKEQLGQDIIDVPGTGAAGGLGAGLIVFCGAQLKSGIETVLDVVNIDRHLPTTDLVITGEGKIDGQSIYGKVPVGVGQRVKKYNLPVLAIVGDIGDGASAVYDYGVDGIMSTVNKAMPLSEAMGRSSELLEDAAERVMRIIKIGMVMRRSDIL